MTVRDWREVDPELLRACYDTEHEHWRLELAWDTSWTWSTLEQARLTWGLPGLVAFDEAGAIEGWAFYMLGGGVLNVGGLVASDEPVTLALLGAILDAAAREDAGATSVFVLDRAPGLHEALAAHGFDAERFLYLSRPLAPGGHQPNVVAVGLSGAADSAGRPDVTELASLLHGSYTPDAARHFAPSGTFGEWVKYATGLVHQRGCGVFDRLATRSVRDDAGLRALALVTSISPATAHLAQMAVRPDCRGRGLAAALVTEACERAGQSGKTRMTLLVGERNAAARRLYDSMGFTVAARFTAAWRPSGSFVANGDLSAAYRTSA